MSKEIWKPILDYPGYEVSNTGQVRKLKNGHWYNCCLWKSNKGRVMVHIWHKREYFNRTVHSLVMLAFVGPKPKGMEICHNDSNPENNQLDNLRYDTHEANIQDAIIQGTLKGLTLKQRNQVKQDLLDGISVGALVNKYGVSKGAIIRTYKLVGLQPHEFSYRRARDIREDFATGNVSYQELEQKYNLCKSQISQIVTGKRCLKAGGPIKGIHY